MILEMNSFRVSDKIGTVKPMWKTSVFVNSDFWSKYFIGQKVKIKSGKMQY